MGILTLAGDSLKLDPLKEDGLKTEYDPMSAAAGKRVKTYDKDLGYAVLPEEKERDLSYKSAIDNQATSQQGAIDTYKSSYVKAMADADTKAAGILGDAEKQLNSVKKQDFGIIPVNVVDASGTKIEGTYYVPRVAVENMAKDEEIVSKWGEDGSFNVSVRTKHGLIRGQEFHDSFRDAAQQTKDYQKMADESYNTAKQAGGIQLDALKGEVATQKNIAQNAYNQNVSQAETVLNTIKSKWTNYVSGQQKAFQNGIKSNAGGIADLVKSGALVMKGSVE